MTKPDNVWISSDFHLGHSNIILFCNRPFTNIDEMSEKILDNINHIVKRRDTFIFLGDFAMGRRNTVAKWSSQIYCENKWIILGNHDDWTCKWWMENGWMWASRFPFLYLDFIIMSHQQQFIQNPGPYINIHGHVHNSLPYRPSSNHWNVSVDVCDFKPIALSQILDEVKKEGGKIHEES
jgi:calcineurin-like phosphoesterase family protein